MSTPRPARATLVLAALWLAAAGRPAGGHAQGRLDGPAVHACSSINQVVLDLRSRTLPPPIARQRLQTIHDVARTSGSMRIRQVAEAHLAQLARADDTMLLMMAEQFRDACR
jgi:hypothetical protein